MIVLDHNHVVQAEAVVSSAGGRHSGFLEQAHSWGGLPGVKDFGGSAMHRRNVFSSECGNAGKTLKEI
jgi:hypothetical protein